MILPLLILINRHEQQNHRKCFGGGEGGEGREGERGTKREIETERDTDRQRETGERERKFFIYRDKHVCFFFFSNFNPALAPNKAVREREGGGGGVLIRASAIPWLLQGGTSGKHCDVVEASRCLLRRRTNTHNLVTQLSMKTQFVWRVMLRQKVRQGLH